MSRLQTKIISEMQSEIAARKHALLIEREQLQKAAVRIAEIDEELAAWDSEKAAYDADSAKIPVEVSVK